MTGGWTSMGHEDLGAPKLQKHKSTYKHKALVGSQMFNEDL